MFSHFLDTDTPSMENIASSHVTSDSGTGLDSFLEAQGSMVCHVDEDAFSESVDTVGPTATKELIGLPVLEEGSSVC